MVVLYYIYHFKDFISPINSVSSSSRSQARKIGEGERGDYPVCDRTQRDAGRGSGQGHRRGGGGEQGLS